MELTNYLCKVQADILTKLRNEAKAVRDPTAADETLELLIKEAKSRENCKILEIGAAEALTSCALALSSNAEISAIELDASRAKKARENIRLFSLENRIRLIEGDAGEILPLLEGEFDIIFLDGPKVQYQKYFPDCKRLLKRGGVLFSDDILLFGWVLDGAEVPPKRKMLVRHIREYLEILTNDPDLQTKILSIGEGLAISKKR